jgi:hypothetical protein
MGQEPRLPTYRTVAGVLEQEKGSGTALLGWTVLRTLLIAPPMMIVGVDTKRAFIGAGIASGLISVFTLLRIFNAKHTGFGRPSSRCLPRGRSAVSSRRARPRLSIVR